jgi:hypothetical protein
VADNIDDVVRYPVAVRFQTVEQLEGYFCGDVVICLQCGGHFKALDSHLRQVHSMTGDEYRAIHNIPWTRVLMAEDHVQLLRDTEHVTPVRDKWVTENPELAEQHLRDMIAMEKRKAVRLRREKKQQRRRVAA